MTIKPEKVSHSVTISAEMSTSLRTLSIYRSSVNHKQVSLGDIVDAALREYFENHREEIKNELLGYIRDGGFITTEEAKFLK